MKLYLSPEACPQLPDLLALAADHAAAREYDRALDLYSRALELLFALDHGPGVLEQKSAVRNVRADLLVGRGLWQQALEELDRVLAAQGDLADPSLVISARAIQAQVHGVYGEYDEALQALEAAMALARTLEDSREEARVQGQLGALQARLGAHRPAQEALRRVLDLVPDPPPDPESAVLRAAALTQLGLAAFRGGQAEVARDLYQQSLDVLGRWGLDTEVEAETRRYMGVLSTVRGRFGEALRHHREALRIALRNRMPLARAKVYNSLGQTCLDMSRLDDALLFMQKAEVLCLELGADAELAAIYGKLGFIFLQREDYPRAVELHRRDVELSRRFGNLRALAFSIRNLGLSLRARGLLEEAGRHLQDALQRFDELRDLGFVVRVHLDLAEVWLDRGDLPEAEESLVRARALMHVDSPDTDRARLWLLTGTLNRLRQHWSDSREAYLEALRILADFGPTGALAQVRFELGQLHDEARDTEQAIYHLRACLDLARQLGMTHLARKAIRLLERLDEVELVDFLIGELEGTGEVEPEPGGAGTAPA